MKTEQQVIELYLDKKKDLEAIEHKIKIKEKDHPQAIESKESYRNGLKLEISILGWVLDENP